MTKQRFIIEDWAGNRKFPNQVFDTQDDGWEFLYAQFPVTEDAPEDEELQEFSVVPLT